MCEIVPRQKVQRYGAFAAEGIRQKTNYPSQARQSTAVSSQADPITVITKERTQLLNLKAIEVQDCRYHQNRRNDAEKPPYRMNERQ